MSRQRILCSAFAALILSGAMGCAVIGRPGYHGPKYMDARQPSGFDTVNLESADLQTATNMAVGRLLASNALRRHTHQPIILVDDAYFTVAADTQVNARALVDLVRNELVNASAGQIRVVQPLEVADAEAELSPPQLLVHDFVLTGRVTDVLNTQRGLAESYTQISLQVVLASTGEVVFSDLYAVKKAGSLTPRLY